jgi:hypothetical protein
MSVSQVDSRIIGATQFALGPLGASIFPTVVRTPTGSWGGQLKTIGVGISSLVSIGPQSVTGISVGGATGVGVGGYPLGASEIFSWNGPACFYVYSTGSSSTIAMTFNFTSFDTNLA